ncbi:tRNA (guanosine(37)-N1)-methyltransferase TrmD [uncultured Faecalibaculum sp.]|uniref:tRNA (guanosine(37)-N1)-methyltransferase TrmD n=1 Tax=uncultured Faecalibaculum sp. TaxID=1729681 RepID=UPI0025FA4425|nr:tRNA (guanosine(37)-N1)-methyltransferase TrmD [uncultured Faecalibaculum sp.]
MKITVLTLFPEYFDAFLNTSIISRAREAGLFEFEAVDFRPYTKQKHGHVDDSPYGGGAGMVLMCQPLLDALEAVRTEDSTVILLSPQGKTFTQQTARQLAVKNHLIFICGHYEGFDERIRRHADMQLSLGDFVLTGGEPAAQVMCDAVLRLLPGTIKDESSGGDSFSDGLLEYPQYTRPYDYKGETVPDILLSGHHANIEEWRRQQSLIRTKQQRPDLLETARLTEKDRKFLESLDEPSEEC